VRCDPCGFGSRECDVRAARGYLADQGSDTTSGDLGRIGTIVASAPVECQTPAGEARRSGLAISKDARVACLDKVWQGLDILVNAASHPERGQSIEPADARFCLHLTAILAEYIQSLGSVVSGDSSLPPP